ncbi:hypothetical protein E4U57_007002 [Claviceps arundinis]|uniref:Uncharacterized protein n=1 Tax=Claviceps arundinis TaxID=1623583 RepID=A0ABQ7P1C7_9HYPO|nr:hypothetical protein E4U57_007002 [Claviceps arundinis]
MAATLTPKQPLLVISASCNTRVAIEQAGPSARRLGRLKRRQTSSSNNDCPKSRSSVHKASQSRNRGRIHGERVTERGAVHEAAGKSIVSLSPSRFLDGQNRGPTGLSRLQYWHCQTTCRQQRKRTHRATVDVPVRAL